MSKTMLVKTNHEATVRDKKEPSLRNNAKNDLIVR
jgi:hypothetical protein